MARKTDIRFRRSATQGAIPTTSQLNLGELALNTYDGKLYMKKNVGGTESIVEVGASSTGLTSSFTLYEYTATANQTTFSGSDNNSNTLAYDTTSTPAKVLVYLNGVLLDDTTDYTASNGTSIVLTNGAAASDILQVGAYKSNATVSSISLEDNQKLQFGDSDDLSIYHNGTDSVIENEQSGHIFITNKVDDKDIIFRTDDGSGGFTPYLTLDGSTTEANFHRTTKVDDNFYLGVGAGPDLYLMHDGTNSHIKNNTGNLTIQNNTDDGDIIFRSDDGSGGTIPYMTIDGGEERIVFNKWTRHVDGTRILVGTGGDLALYHDGTNSYIKNDTGDLIVDAATDITLDADGGDIRLKDNGTQFARFGNFLGSLAITSGASDVAMIIGNTDGSMIMGGNVNIGDNKRLRLGNGPDLQLYHDGTHSYIDSSTGSLYIRTANTLQFKNQSGSETLATFAVNGASTLYHDNSAKLATTSSGVSVTGELDVSGDVEFFDETTSNNHKLTLQKVYNRESAIEWARGTDVDAKIRVDSSEDLIFDYNFSNLSADLIFRSNNSEVSRFLANGNLGINTASPGRKLDVSSGGSDVPQIRASYNSTNYLDLKHNLINAVSSGGNDALQLQTAGTTGLTINVNQNVGIGTTNPSGKLHVYDSGTDTYGTQPIAIFDYYDTDDTALRYSARIGDGATTFKTFVTSSATDFLIQDQDNQAGRLAFQVTGNAGSNQILAAESTGKVGIGTITPSYPLEVAGNVSINTNSGNKGLRIITAADSEAYVIFGDGSDNSMGSIVYNNASNYLSLSANNAERMRIISSGRVGLQTTDPRAHLDVAGGTIRSQGFSTITGGAGIEMRYDSSNTWGGILVFDRGTSSYQELRLEGSIIKLREAGSDVLIVDNSRVGIGTTSPGAKLDVESTGVASTPTIEITNTSSSTFNHSINAFAPNLTSGENNLIVIGRAGSTKNSGYIGYKYSGAGSNANVLTFGHWASDNLLNLTGDGKLGIGTITPDYKLEVEGDGHMIRATGTTAGGTARIGVKNLDDGSANNNAGADVYLQSSGWGEGYVYVGANSISTAGGDFNINAANGVDLAFRVNGSSTAAMFLDTSGNLSIGNTAANAKLDIRQDSGYAIRAENGSGHYFRVAAGGAIEVGGSAFVDASRNITSGNITTTGYLRGPSSFTIDPATHGDNTGTVVIAGNLQVDGTTTTINSTTLSVTDKLITLAKGSANAAAANGAGIEVEISGATNPSILYDGTNDEWDFNKEVNVSGNIFVKVADARIGSDVGAVEYGTSTNNSTRFYTNNAERMRIQGGGNVGIGTSGPDTKLHINQTSNGNFVEALRIENSGGGANEGGYINWEVANTNGHGARIGGRREGTGGIGLHFYTGEISSAPSERMRISHDGAVGIGTTGPSTRLHVKHDSNASTGITVENTSTGTGARAMAEFKSDAAQLNVYATGSNYSGVSSWADAGVLSTSSSSSNGLILNAQSGGIKFQYGTTERMRVHTNGNIGIGATAPSQKLDVRGGNVMLGGYGGGVDYGLILTPADSASYWHIYNDTSGELVFGRSLTIGSNEYARFDSQGRLGINTNDPYNGTRVHICADDTSPSFNSTAIDDTTLVLSNSDDDYGTVFGTFGTGVGVIQQRRTATATYYNLLINPYGGNVGVATASPSAKFQVEEYGIDTTETSTSATTQVAIHTFAAATFRSARFTIQVTNSTDSSYHTVEVLLVHDGTTANITEFAEIFTGSAAEASFDADISSGNVRLLATPASTDSMEFKVVCHSITV